MRPIDADTLKKEVLKWLPSDPCGIEEKEIPFETDIVVSLLMEIEEAPTIEGEWIPCSERLPDEEFGTYLICTENGYMCSCRWTNDMYGLGQTEWSKWGWHVMDKPQYSTVVAWMPLPEWEGADDED